MHIVQFRRKAGPALQYSQHPKKTDIITQRIPFRNTPSVNSTTRRSTPPPGASRSTFGTKPLYSAAAPSSRKIVTSEGYVQLYFGATPGTFTALWMRDFTTCEILSIGLILGVYHNRKARTSNLAMEQLDGMPKLHGAGRLTGCSALCQQSRQPSRR